MNKLLILLASIFLLPIETKAPNSHSAFRDGEWFQFRIHYGIFNASYATLSVNETTLKGKDVYHVVGKGSTTGLARMFFKVDDNYESYFDKEKLIPYKFIRQIDEGGYTKDLEINFNHEQDKATVFNHKHNRTTTINTPDGIQDLISAFYYLRNSYDFSNFKIGQEVDLELLYDDDEIFNFKLRFLGWETLNTKFGKVRCLKFRPYVQSGRIFKEKESVTLWVSDDKNRVPVRIQADLIIGSLKADLNAFKGLKHQFKIQLD
ncbi:Protein of unknown function [Zhouia amylolytica]|uniref:ATP-dependent exonuclease n=2 Tax=Zhouia amylolytica TaxID=376730 RepID=W2UKC6_9FLAO|nr:DUF3108 domain-containing protein [Zhouia amylolytica]ETN94458.1 protein of unknown function (DUF3108) [Zhouia amylolytica AD3]MCQ0110320.1 DUF3108 domain-containing protein [Zhouia amylolytica]SFT12340.1 Protein of unknown function [Zhouia amylolytica]